MGVLSRFAAVYLQERYTGEGRERKRDLPIRIADPASRRVRQLRFVLWVVPVNWVDEHLDARLDSVR
jgi:hypothetical protein